MYRNLLASPVKPFLHRLEPRKRAESEIPAKPKTNELDTCLPIGVKSKLHGYDDLYRGS
jgi:hypothetical protein